MKHLPEIGSNPYGTRVVQTQIDKLKTKEDCLKFSQALEPLLSFFLKNSNAYHIIVKCIMAFDEGSLQFIYNFLKRNVHEVATNKVGCCAFQKCLDFATSSPKQQLMNSVYKNVIKLIFDSQGHYVINHVVSFKNFKFTKDLVEKVLEELNFKVICKHKYSSTILEKCLEFSTLETRKIIIDHLKEETNFRELISDQNGSRSKQNK